MAARADTPCLKSVSRQGVSGLYLLLPWYQGSLGLTDRLIFPRTPQVFFFFFFFLVKFWQNWLWFCWLASDQFREARKQQLPVLVSWGQPESPGLDQIIGLCLLRLPVILPPPPRPTHELHLVSDGEKMPDWKLRSKQAPSSWTMGTGGDGRRWISVVLCGLKALTGSW